MNGSAPNRPATGFHSLPVRNPKPKVLIDRRAFEAIEAIIAATSSNTVSAQQKSRARNAASPLLPVGESVRRQFHARKRAP
jgi:hypothetical protein